MALGGTFFGAVGSILGFVLFFINFGLLVHVIHDS